MKAYVLLILILSLALSSLNAQAGDEQKHVQLGISSYALIVAYNNSSDDEFSGTAFSAAYAPTDNVAFRGTFYSIENDDFSELESSGYDLIIYVGTGLASEGFKIYGGGGIFNETWELFGFEEDFSGIQFGGGLGYNWDAVALDLVVAVRDVSDYEDALGPIGLIVDTVVTSALTLSVRF